MRRWIKYYISGAFVGLLVIALMNIFVDPFGVFGDRFLNYYGYNMTNNPRTAKIAYIDKNHKKYNSYIFGSSKTSSISPESLNKYYDGASFYNMMVYGIDLKHIEQMVKYTIDNYDVENIVLNVGVTELITYDNQTRDVKEELHGKVRGEALSFFAKYLFLNPSYSIEKLNAFASEPLQEKPTEKNVFLPELGVYNKTKRDAENILNINDYVQEIGGGTFLTNPKFLQNDIADECLASIAEIKSYCDDNGISFMLISSPNYELELTSFELDYVRDYFIELSRITEFWNFSGYNSISGDPRFFYDSVHFRNFVGDMMLGKIFGGNVYSPEDFGVYMTEENAVLLSEKILTPRPDLSGYIDLNSPKEEISLPVLMYHHIVEDGEQLNLATITISKFREDMETFKEAGYNTIFLEDAVKYANGELQSLPDKPLVITFDDGYMSNYEYAFQILKELDMKATINIIGWSFGVDNGKIIPHFGEAELNEMLESGLIKFGSHTYDLHTEGDRDGVLKKNNETTAEYFNALEQDNKLIFEIVETDIICYPYGKANIMSELVFRELGYNISLLIENKVGKIAKGKPYTLNSISRINAAYNITSKELLELIGAEQ